jgi:hypothetical protein
MQFDLAVFAIIYLLAPIQNRLRTKLPQLLFDLGDEGAMPDVGNCNCHGKNQRVPTGFDK